MAIIAINFNDGPVDGFLNLKGLAPLFPEYENSDVVLEIEDWMSPEKNNGINNHYFVGEFLLDKLPFHLERF